MFSPPSKEGSLRKALCSGGPFPGSKAPVFPTPHCVSFPPSHPSPFLTPPLYTIPPLLDKAEPYSSSLRLAKVLAFDTQSDPIRKYTHAPNLSFGKADPPSPSRPLPSSYRASNPSYPAHPLSPSLPPSLCLVYLFVPGFSPSLFRFVFLHRL